MGLFNFLKKKSPEQKPVKKMEQIRTPQGIEQIQNYQKDEAGLYPYEILMLSYLEKYAEGKDPARFWKKDYGVDDVPTLIKSLEQRGFAKGGKLTESGKAEIAKNEYVLYVHRHKSSEISMSRMSILVNQQPNMRYRDLIWGEYNRLTIEHMKNRQFGWYRNTKFAMYQFLLEERRYVDAFPLLAEVFFYDLNGSESPYIAPALIEEVRSIEQKINYIANDMEKILQRLFSQIYSPYRNYTKDDIIKIIIAYAFGNDELAEKYLTTISDKAGMRI